ncbi:MAG: S8 family serine peptidase, partial [Actinomycetota bacterium]
SHHESGQPAVANMSLGGSRSAALDLAVARGTADGVVFVVAAGNSNANACNFSPAAESSAITVGATTTTDTRASYSNYGSCLDVFAPGSNITSAWFSSTTATNTISGTSMASPHVAGVAALALSANRTLSVARVALWITSTATQNLISDVAGSTNKLLYSLLSATSPELAPEDTPTTTTTTTTV